MTINKKELVQQVSKRVSQNTDLVEEIVDATLEEICESLKRHESVSVRNFGTFYIRGGRDSCVFKFDPSQKLRKIFGWSSTYKGEV